MTIDFPVTVEIFGKAILIHPILESVGIFVAMRYYALLKRRNQSNLSIVQSLSIILGALIGALLGSKIIGTLENSRIA